MEDIKEIFMFLPSSEGREEGPYRIALTIDGRADLSKVPERYQNNWEKFGIRDPFLGKITIMPKEGKEFLWMLLNTSSNGYTPWFERATIKNKKI